MIGFGLKRFYFALFGFPMRANAFRHRLFQSKKSGQKVHLGPGQGNYLNGWINVDANFLTAKIDVWANISDTLPFRTGTIDAFYSHHVIEHLSDSALGGHFSDMLRCLKPGGVIRVGGPNGNSAIKKFLANDKKWFSDFPDRRESIGGRFANFILCRGEHLSILTASYLTELAVSAGFTDISICQPLTFTNYPAIFDKQVLDRKSESDPECPHTLLIEARKPDWADNRDWRVTEALQSDYGHLMRVGKPHVICHVGDYWPKLPNELWDRGTAGNGNRMAQRALFSIICALFLFAGLTAARAQQPAAPPAGVATTSDAGTNGSYTLGSGDKVRINVFGQADLQGEYVIDGAGFVQLPFIGQTKAAGLTVTEFQKQVTEKLGNGYLVNPNVDVQVVAYRPFYIIGEVRTPGQYAYINGMSVLNAVALAGGYTDRADKSEIYIRRNGASKEVEYPADETTKVNPGDIVRISERFF